MLHFDEGNREWERIKWIYKCLDYWVASQLEQQTRKGAQLGKGKLARVAHDFRFLFPHRLVEYANSDNLYSSEGLPFLWRFSTLINSHFVACFSDLR